MKTKLIKRLVRTVKANKLAVSAMKSAKLKVDSFSAVVYLNVNGCEYSICEYFEDNKVWVEECFGKFGYDFLCVYDLNPKKDRNKQLLDFARKTLVDYLVG